MVLTVKEHNFMLTKQYLLRCNRKAYSNHQYGVKYPPKHIGKGLSIYEAIIEQT